MAEVSETTDTNLERGIKVTKMVAPRETSGVDMTDRTHAYRYRLTKEAEDALLQKKEARKMLADKYLCAEYDISRSTLRQALLRARARRRTQTPEQKVGD